MLRNDTMCIQLSIDRSFVSFAVLFVLYGSVSVESRVTLGASNANAENCVRQPTSRRLPIVPIGRGCLASDGQVVQRQAGAQHPTLRSREPRNTSLWAELYPIHLFGYGHYQVGCVTTGSATTH